MRPAITNGSTGRTVPVKPKVPLGPWARRGACASSDPDLFFPAYGRTSIAAKRLCRACPVRSECLEYALEAPEESGIWGGLDEAERKSLARRRRRLAAKAGAT
jgi:WhiB family redox-sensing transcriptional regulator